MKKFNVTIEEVISEDFEVLAEDEKQAIEIIRDKYKKGEFVLEPGNLLSKQMKINDKFLEI